MAGAGGRGTTVAACLVAVLLATSAGYLLISSSTRDNYSRLRSLFTDDTAAPPPGCPDRMRVYMYDLPPRFNVDMLTSSRSVGVGPVHLTDLPPWPASAGIRTQHSVEYWMTASVLHGSDEVVRAEDGEDADLFFVPFFSSLSVNVHGRNMTDPETEVDRLLQVELIEILNKSPYWQRSAGRDHVIAMTHPNAFRFLRDLVNASILLVVDFGRYPRSTASLKKDVVTPYVHVVDSFLDDESPDPFESRPTLLFFRGRTVRKDDGKVRAKLLKLLQGHDDVHFEKSFATVSAIKETSQGMRSSKFCLHPAGDTPSSCRLFDAIVSHCVPVIVSDRIELPFEDKLDYSEFALFYSVEEALQPDYLLTQLRQFPKERWTRMWAMLKNVSHHFEFQHPAKKDDAVNMIWQQVRQKLPAVNLAAHRNRRLKIPDWWR